MLVSSASGGSSEASGPNKGVSSTQPLEIGVENGELEKRSTDGESASSGRESRLEKEIKHMALIFQEYNNQVFISIIHFLALN